ncbi:hypothetical protein GLOIN_2v1868421 [Rhizophagus irregularis DAOM 181602=DAOM 197198]|nr:hypothetical protein GLOIN_2v1868421 [Rhizophagus irregularis DAOM 181602=DAOM 197198]
MSIKFFTKLSQNYIELLKDDEYYDITIEVVHIKLPNISPEIFQIILEYIYGGIISLNMNDASDFIKVLAAADKLHLQELVNYLQNYLIENKEFSQKVRPYQKLFDQQLYEELLNSYLDPGSVSNDNILRPRNIKINEIKIINSQIIDSKIVDSNIISTVSKRIDKMTNNDENYKKSYLPYKFELLLRGSRDGFTPKRFHELCDGKPKTVTFIKVKGTEEIIGGYNPLIWETSHIWGVTKNSFIFSFKNRYVVISKVKNSNYALDYSTKCGPQFGSDLIINSYKDSNSNEYTNFNYLLLDEVLDNFFRRLLITFAVFVF